MADKPIPPPPKKDHYGYWDVEGDIPGGGGSGGGSASGRFHQEVYPPQPGYPRGDRPPARVQCAPREYHDKNINIVAYGDVYINQGDNYNRPGCGNYDYRYQNGNNYDYRQYYPRQCYQPNYYQYDYRGCYQSQAYNYSQYNYQQYCQQPQYYPQQYYCQPQYYPQQSGSQFYVGGSFGGGGGYAYGGGYGGGYDSGYGGGYDSGYGGYAYSRPGVSINLGFGFGGGGGGGYRGGYGGDYGYSYARPRSCSPYGRR